MEKFYAINADSEFEILGEFNSMPCAMKAYETDITWYFSQEGIKSFFEDLEKMKFDNADDTEDYFGLHLDGNFVNLGRYEDVEDLEEALGNHTTEFVAFYCYETFKAIVEEAMKVRGI